MNKKNQTKYSGFSPIKFTIKKKAVEAKMQGHLNKALVLKAWGEISGQYIFESAELTRAVDYRNGVLHVVCLSKEVAYKIKLLAKRIAESINKILEKNLVFAINIEI